MNTATQAPQDSSANASERFRYGFLKGNPQLTKSGELKHLLSIEGLPKAIVNHILETADQFVSVTDREVKKVPLLRGNPMAKDHVTALLDALAALDADGVAARAVADAAAALAEESGEFDAGLVVVDDLMGGWTNLYAAEFTVDAVRPDQVGGRVAEAETARHHADDLGCDPVDRDRLADHVRVASETALPVSVAQHRNRRPGDVLVPLVEPTAE